MCERNINHTAGDLVHNTGMCPDWVSDPRTFGFQTGTQSTEPHQPQLFFFFLKYILLILLLQLSHFSLLYPPLPCIPPPTSIPLPFGSCLWVIHVSSLASSFPILFLTSPVYFVPTIYASYSLYLLPHSPPPPPC